MKRRTLLGALGGLLASGMAGCTGSPDTRRAAPATTTTRVTPSTTAPDCTFPETSALVTETPTPTKSPTGSLSELTVTAAAGSRTTFVLYPEDRDAPTRVVSLDGGGRADLSDETRYWTNYRVVVYVDCERVGEVPVYSYEAATVAVGDGGSVEKTVHAEA